MEEIKVSVLCLIYNHGKYLRQMLDGLLMQETNFAYEIILHDDASTDNSQIIIKEYYEQYPEIIRPILQRENVYSKGVNAVFDVMFPISRGNYIAICEGDDYWTDKKKLQKQYDLMEKELQCSICTHIVNSCEEDGSPNAFIMPNENSRLNSLKYKGQENICVLNQNEFMRFLWLEDGYPFHTSSFFIRRHIFEVDYTTKGIWNTRDTYWLLACAYQGGVVYIKEPMSTYRNHSDGSWTMTINKQGKAGWYNLYKEDFKKCMYFDAYTNYIYHDMILTKLFGRTLKWSLYNPKECRQRLLDNEISYSIVRKNLNGKNRLKGWIGYLILVKMNWILRLISHYCHKG